MPGIAEKAIVWKDQSAMARQATHSIRINETIEIPEDALEEQFIQSAGPGGQNVNKVATAVQLRFDVRRTPHLPEHAREQALRLAGRRATKEGVIVIEAQRFRTREQNRADARERLARLLAKAAEPPPRPRKKTKPSKAAVERRLKEKAERAGVKRMRSKVRPE